MSSGTTFDPFAMMGFTGYIDPATGRPDQYHSLAHFVYSERLAGVDEQYRRYLLQMVDPELFRLEVDGVGIAGQDAEGWSEVVQQLLYAGIFMQALSNRESFGSLLGNADRLTVASCAFSQDAAIAMGRFIGDVRQPQDKLKVVFLGDCRDVKFVDECLSVIFGKRAPQCVLALEDDGCSVGVSGFARKTVVPFSLLSSSLTDEAIVESIRIRCTHVFNFQGGRPGDQTTRVLDQLRASGLEISQIPARK
ncbi:hypothetical protein NPS53_08640 [Pseudomonas putida]|uniref:hypothetical protein n=1 Tax=Pseudomonas putida TaxID=303 RepID=UPI0023648E62|nr:hypothetical protein [Pseudomonas putida]MDD2139640.1 hypothetical protein [Pseudomonas putida]HDS1721563.1 hypothetical protein [Pseudomonas putida]